jgi:hypothetical protein
VQSTLDLSYGHLSALTVDGTEDSWYWTGAESYDQGKGEEQPVRMVRPKNTISTWVRVEAIKWK